MTVSYEMYSYEMFSNDYLMKCIPMTVSYEMFSNDCICTGQFMSDCSSQRFVLQLEELFLSQ